MIEPIITNLKTTLTSIFGVTDWSNIGFSMLPDDQPIGYLQVTKMKPGITTDIEVMVGIGISDQTLDGLMFQVYNQLDTIEANLVNPTPCLDGGGQLKVSSDIMVDMPDSYVNNGGISITNGYRVSITFALMITKAR